jgi:hypothetical protein
MENDRWTTKIEELFNAQKLTSHQCVVYNKDSQPAASNATCGCQRRIRDHSFDGTPPQTKPKPEEWNVENHTRNLPSLVYRSTRSTKVSTFTFLLYHDRIFSLQIDLVLTMFV